MDPTLACFRGKNEYVNKRSFNVYLRDMREIKKRSELSDIDKVELIANYEKKVRTLYTFFDLKKCDEDQLTYIIKIYSKILEILKELKPQNDDELTEYKGYYKEVEDAYTKVREARKEIIVESITRAVNKSRSQSMFHIPNDMKMPPVLREHKESVSVLDFAKSHKKSSNPYAIGNEREHRKYIEEQREKKQNSVISPDGPPPPPPKGQRPSSRSRESSSRQLLDSRSLGRSLGMTAKIVPKFSQSRSRRGGKTRRRNKKQKKLKDF